MDLSKLPKLSDTKSHQATGESPAAEPIGSVLRPVPVVTYRQPGVGVDIWISLIIGLLLLMLGGRFGSYAVAKISHSPYHTGLTWDSDGPEGKAGDEIEYFSLPSYTALSEMGLFFFGAMLLFEAGAKTVLVLKPGRLGRIALGLALLTTAAAVLLNLYAAIKMYNIGIIPTLSMLAVAFGGWVLFDEIATLKAVTPAAKPAQ
jgi:hypothetical protein